MHTSFIQHRLRVMCLAALFSLLPCFPPPLRALEAAVSSPLLDLVAQAAEPDRPGPEAHAGTPAVSEELAERRRLEALPPASIPVQEAPLGAALCLVATAAGMNFIAPDPAVFTEPVTLSTRVSPWRLLGLLAERYQFTLCFRSGVWVFDRTPAGTFVSRTYELRHTNLDSFKASQNSFGLLSSSNPGAESQVSGGLVFTPQTQKIIDDLRELVGRSAQSKGQPADNAPEGQGRVLYLADSNALYVTATPAQHEHVAAYLRLVDRPVRQIRIEARFFETTHDPRKVIGIDPTGLQPTLHLENLSTTFDLGRLGSLHLPDKVLLSAEALRFQIQALQTDERSKLVNNPTVVVANNREAYFSVGDEEPFVSANTIGNGVADGGLGTTQAQVAIRRIGTSVNLVPTLFEGAEGEAPRIRLSVRIEVGVLKGFRQLNSVSVPVVTSQKYEYTVYLRAGETLAFGGLSGTSEGESLKKVPVAGDIPVLGLLFRSKSRQSSQRNLVAYLSASVVGEEPGPAASAGPVADAGSEAGPRAAEAPAPGLADARGAVLAESAQ